MNNVKVFIPIKEVSERVPGKNFRLLGGKPLWERCVDKFCSEFDVHINTDSSIILESQNRLAPKNVYVHERPQYLRGHTVSVNLILADWIRTCNSVKLEDIVCQIHVTNPFLTCKTIMAAYERMKDSSVDSVAGCNVLRSRLWKQESFGFCPVNHNPMDLIPTQNLPPIYEENSTFYMFRVSSFLRTMNRFGHGNCHFIEVPFPENVDIDTEQDWNICKCLEPVSRCES